MDSQAYIIVLSVSLSPSIVRADDLLHAFEGDVFPFPDGGWWNGGCGPSCHESFENGNFVLRWDHGTADQVSYGYYISRLGIPPAPPPPFWVEWRFRSNHRLQNNAGCDGQFLVQYAELFDHILFFGDAVVSADKGIVSREFPVGEFATYRFETLDGVFGCFFVDGKHFVCNTGTGGNGSSIIQMIGRGGCDLTQPATVNEWDFVRYGTIGYGETIVGVDPPVPAGGGFIDARTHSALDRFTVTFDQPNYVYFDEVTVAVSEPRQTWSGPFVEGAEALRHEGTKDDGFRRPASNPSVASWLRGSVAAILPWVTATRRQDNGPPETVEIVLDRPIPYNATTRFTFDDGTIEQTVELTYAPGDTDGDSDADLSDFAAFQNCFGADATDAPCPVLDFNTDDSITRADFAAFQSILAGH